MTSINPSFGDNVNNNLQKANLDKNVQINPSKKETMEFGIKPLPSQKGDTVELSIKSDAQVITDDVPNLDKPKKFGLFAWASIFHHVLGFLTLGFYDTRRHAYNIYKDNNGNN